MSLLKSCDTFVVLPPLTSNNTVIFGKNSDRPQNEVQEVVYIKGGTRAAQLKCTYITIEETSRPVHSVILSKPSWMWGAEMGANDRNVCIGNEAVWTNHNEGDGDARLKRLLGMDLVRLGLERGDTAQDALNVITSLLEKHGQGGACSEHDDSHFYHNSFLIADSKEAWVLETSGKLWAAEKIENGYRNISNGLTIKTKIDRYCDGLHAKAVRMGLWDGKGEFNFTKSFSSGGDEKRQEDGETLIKQVIAFSPFNVRDMFNILRHKDSHICRGCDDTFPTQGSQVSRLSTEGISVHWFTATPDPSISFYKPFIFTPDVKISPYTISPPEGNREHHLYKLHTDHSSKVNRDEMSKALHDMEEKRLEEIDEFIEKFKPEQSSSTDLDDIMKVCVETEVKLYSSY